jgi:uncharacterized protein (DUF4415 family)
MSTKNTEIDYEEFLKNNKPDSSKVRRGLQSRQERRKEHLETEKQKITIRLDTEVIESFKQLAPNGRGYQRLINQALHEWLNAKGVNELLEKKIEDLVGEAISSIREAVESSKPAR